jgi:hypothetical protein
MKTDFEDKLCEVIYAPQGFTVMPGNEFLGALQGFDRDLKNWCTNHNFCAGCKASGNGKSRCIIEKPENKPCGRCVRGKLFCTIDVGQGYLVLYGKSNLGYEGEGF